MRGVWRPFHANTLVTRCIFKEVNMWKKTTAEICIAIRKEHKEDLEVFGSYTDVDGNGYEWSSGHPEIMTKWGFKGAEKPLYKVIMEKEYKLDEKWTYEYYLYCV